MFVDLYGSVEKQMMGEKNTHTTKKKKHRLQNEAIQNGGARMWNAFWLNEFIIAVWIVFHMKCTKNSFIFRIVYAERCAEATLDVTAKAWNSLNAAF